MKPPNHLLGLYSVVFAIRRDNRLSSSTCGRGKEKTAVIKSLKSVCIFDVHAEHPPGDRFQPNMTYLEILPT